jgi:ABC-2 type transport system permease protein
VNGFVGTGALVRLALRRDRILIPVWLFVFVLMAAGSAGATAGLYPSVASRVAAAQVFNTTQSLVALYGKVYDPTSLGALSMIKLGGTGAIFVAVLAIVLMVRHTRAEEEAGRLELVGAGVVGRYAPLTAALSVVIGTYLVLGVLTGLGLIAAGLPTNGSFAFGFAWAGVGIAFAAIAAVTAQLTSVARAATGIAVATLGVVYVLRAVGDTAEPGGPGWLTWLSPVGWGQQFRPYAGDRWWVLLITIGFAVVMIGAAYALVARRDLGAGLVPDRLGPAAAPARLRSPLALAWRLQRGALLGWAVGLGLMSLVFGNIASNLGSLLNSPQMKVFLERLGGAGAVTDTYLSFVFGIIGVVASAYGIQAANRLRGEETTQRLESLLGTAVTRTRWALSHTAIALFGVTVLMVVSGLSAGVAHASRIGDPGQIGRLTAAALVHVPAAWVLTGIVVAAFGLAPRLIAVGWVALVAFVLLGELGPVFKLNQRIMDISPYAHVPRLPSVDLDPVPVVALTAVAAALLALGLVAFRRRDVPVT